MWYGVRWVEWWCSSKLSPIGQSWVLPWQHPYQVTQQNRLGLRFVTVCTTNQEATKKIMTIKRIDNGFSRWTLCADFQWTISLSNAHLSSKGRECSVYTITAIHQGSELNNTTPFTFFVSSLMWPLMLYLLWQAQAICHKPDKNTMYVFVQSQVCLLGN